MNPAPLLSPTDPRYLRRLVRELNGLIDGFYCGPLRFTRARLRKGELEGRRVFDCGRVGWLGLDADRLGDVYGRNVCASRKP